MVQNLPFKISSRNLSVFARDEVEASPGFERLGAATPCHAAPHSHYTFSLRGTERWMEREKMSQERKREGWAAGRQIELLVSLENLFPSSHV